MDYTNLIALGLTFLSAFLTNTKDKLPAEIVSSVQSLIAALEAHKNDLITKAALEAQRG
jgi:hypothetical protein